jgi:hypothetical protein
MRRTRAPTSRSSALGQREVQAGELHAHLGCAGRHVDLHQALVIVWAAHSTCLPVDLFVEELVATSWWPSSWNGRSVKSAAKRAKAPPALEIRGAVPELKWVRTTDRGTAEEETAQQLLCLLLEMREQIRNTDARRERIEVHVERIDASVCRVERARPAPEDEISTRQ